MSDVPLVDLGWQRDQIAADVEHGWREVLDTTAFIRGHAATRFEQEFARYCRVQHCVGTANGTDALEIACRVAGVGSGDRVVLPANTFVATAEAVVRAGAVPVLVDCDTEHLLIDVDQALDAVNREAARAVVPVHLFGQLAPVEHLVDALDADRCQVVEDAAQSQGATRHDRPMGTWGVAAATSFYPGKNLGAYGDAGAVLTDDAELAARARAIGDHGSERKYHHDLLGFNSRLDGLQAVVLEAKLGRLDAWNALRQAAADQYGALLADDARVQLPATLQGNRSVWHLFVVRVAHRDRVLEGLHRAGIGAGVHYPVPIHLHQPFADLGHGPGSFPNAEAAATEILSLPIYPGITPEQVEQVVDALRTALDDAGVPGRRQ
jgi:dTDP-4-amino-4,6-dideoxygalactose transaminase